MDTATGATGRQRNAPEMAHEVAAPAVHRKKRDRPSTQSTLWIFAALNYLYCDVVSLMDRKLLQGYLAGNVGGLHITQGFLLGTWADHDWLPATRSPSRSPRSRSARRTTSSTSTARRRRPSSPQRVRSPGPGPPDERSSCSADLNVVRPRTCAPTRSTKKTPRCRTNSTAPAARSTVGTASPRRRWPPRTQRSVLDRCVSRKPVGWA
jgi:hypothetical protein